MQFGIAPLLMLCGLSISFSMVHVEDCSFENCAFKKVTFQNATLINNFFKIKNKSLKGIRFIDCKADRMTYEFLKNGKADLTGITLLTPKGGNE